MKSWLYIESFIFIWENNMLVLFYNYLNAKKIIIKKTELISCIIKDITNPTSFYCIEMNEKYLTDEDVSKMITIIKNNLFGNIVYNPNRPINIPPLMVFPKASLDRKYIKLNKFYDDRVLDNLIEITIQLSGTCTKRCKNCNTYKLQFMHCYRSGNDLSIKHLKDIVNKVYFLNIQKINLIGGELLTSNFCWDKIDLLQTLQILKIYYLNFHEVINTTNIRRLLEYNKNMLIKIIIHLNYSQKEILSTLGKLEQYSKLIVIIFIISTDDELKKIKLILRALPFEYELYPFFNGLNQSFIVQNAFLTLEDIDAISSTKKQIFANQTINRNYFGKIYVDSHGFVYDNLNFKPVGNILKNCLDSILYTIFLRGNSWFWLRKNHYCKKCIFRFLCPPPTNIEHIMKVPTICQYEKVMRQINLQSE